MRYLILLLALAACSEPPAPSNRPTLPAAMRPAHPWVARQPQATAIQAMTDDMTAIARAHAHLCPDRPFLEETTLWMEQLLALQETLPLTFPPHVYSCMNIPTPSTYQRLHLATSHLGMPIYLDVRVFSLADAASTIQTHLDTLDADYQITYHGSNLLARGVGLPTNPIHHVALGERALFLAAIPDGDRLLILYAYGPPGDLAPHWELFTAITTSIFCEQKQFDEGEK